MSWVGPLRHLTTIDRSTPWHGYAHRCGATYNPMLSNWSVQEANCLDCLHLAHADRLIAVKETRERIKELESQ